MMTSTTNTHIYWTLSNTIHCVCVCFPYPSPYFSSFQLATWFTGILFLVVSSRSSLLKRLSLQSLPFIGLLKYSANFILALGRNTGQPGNPLDSRRSLLCRHCQQEPYFKLENSDSLPHSGEPALCQLAQRHEGLNISPVAVSGLDPSGTIMWKQFPIGIANSATPWEHNMIDLYIVLSGELIQTDPTAFNPWPSDLWILVTKKPTLT